MIPIMVPVRSVGLKQKHQQGQQHHLNDAKILRASTCSIQSTHVGMDAVT